MTHDEWWETTDKDFSPRAIPDEIKYFSEKAWNKAVCVMMDQDLKLRKIGSTYNRGVVKNDNL